MREMSGFVSEASGWVCVAVWFFLAGFRGGFWRLRERLPQRNNAQAFDVCSVIPARDEASVIGRSIASLRAQQFRGSLRITVVDDESRDDTANVAAAAGAHQVIEAGRRPTGWTGKLWAVSQGIRSNESHNCAWLLLTDADIEHVSPAMLASLLAKAEEGYDLVSVMVRLRCESAAEKLLIPAFVFFFFMLYPPAWVARKHAWAAAAGGCMLVQRQTLERAGGMEAIRSELIDDCALAARVKQSGGRVWLGVSEPEIRSIREYGEFGEIRAMISRTAFVQLRHSTLLLLGTIAGLLITYVAPVFLLILGSGIPAALGGLAWLTSALLFLPTVREYRAPLWTALCLPGIAVFYLAATVESAIRYWRGQGGIWKGRTQDTNSPA